jgi:A/G-specific adenine glycosylase
MLRGRELAAFRKQLLGWFRQFQRNLPWRRTKDPYRIWLSEIMLQQTRVAAAIPYYERFLLRFPDVHSLATAPEEEVLRLWSGLGYYSRARNLQKAAQQIVAKHGGQFPSWLEDALALPGIGNYTAAAILSIAFDAKQAVLDGNVARVLARLGAIRGDLHESQLRNRRNAGSALSHNSVKDANRASPNPCRRNARNEPQWKSFLPPRYSWMEKKKLCCSLRRKIQKRKLPQITCRRWFQECGISSQFP